AKIDSAGYDAGKKIKGKKRHTAVDTLGLLINFAVSPGDVQDRSHCVQAVPLAREGHRGWRLPRQADGRRCKRASRNSARDRQALRRGKGILRVAQALDR